MTLNYENIIKEKTKEINACKIKKPLSLLENLCLDLPPKRDLYSELIPMSNTPVKLIAECQPAQNESGKIDLVGNSIAFTKKGAVALSLSTGFSNSGQLYEDLLQMSQVNNSPIWCRDFIIDEYQIFHACAKGADSYTLLPRLLDRFQLQYLIEIGRDLDMHAVIEVSSPEDFEKALSSDSRIFSLNLAHLMETNQGNKLIKDALNKKNRFNRGRIYILDLTNQKSLDIASHINKGWNSFLVGSTHFSLI